MAKRKRVDSGDQEEPVSKPAASTDSETSDSDDEVRQSGYSLGALVVIMDNHLFWQVTII